MGVDCSVLCGMDEVINVDAVMIFGLKMNKAGVWLVVRILIKMNEGAMIGNEEQIGDCSLRRLVLRLAGELGSRPRRTGSCRLLRLLAFSVVA